MNTREEYIFGNTEERIRTQPVEYVVISLTDTFGSNILEMMKGVMARIPNFAITANYLVDNYTAYHIDDESKYFNWFVGITPQEGCKIHNGNTVSIVVKATYVPETTDYKISEGAANNAKYLCKQLIEQYPIKDIISMSNINPSKFIGYESISELIYEIKSELL